MARRARVAFTATPLPLVRGASVVARCTRVRPTACASPARPVVLAPGQGAQTEGMGLAWSLISEPARALLEEADQLLMGELPGLLSDLMLQGGPKLDRTDVAQPALFVTGAMSLAANDYGTPLAAGGLSLGEYTALYAAGALSFKDGVRLVAARGAAMQSAAMGTDGGMVALIGATEEMAREIAKDASEGDVLVAANFNAPGQVVLSGATEAIDRAAVAAKKIGLRHAILDVAGAFHSPLMQPAADELKKELARITFSPLQCPVVSNVTGEPFVDGHIAEALSRSLTSEVRWEKCVRHLLSIAKDTENTQFLELAPGRTLAGMMRKIDRKIKVLSLDTPVPEPSAA